MKILVTGVGGQLGHDVMNELIGRGHTGVGSDIAPEYSGVADGSAVTTAEYVPMDITDAAQVSEVITTVSPDVVIHCAAWTAVDAAEDDDKKAEIFSHMAEAFDDALFALPIMVRKEDLVVEDGNTYVARSDADFAIRMLSSEDNGDQANIVPLFTSQEDIETLDGWNAEDEERKSMLLTADLVTHLGGLNNGEAFDALVINPFTDNIVLTKEILTTMGLIEGEE